MMLDQFGQPLDCVVRNVSGGGACLALPTFRSVPDNFQLLLHTDRSVQQCRVVWRRDAQLGVSFLNIPSPLAAPIRSCVRSYVPADGAAHPRTEGWRRNIVRVALDIEDGLMVTVGSAAVDRQRAHTVAAHVA
jgi:hypothetical protein